MRVHVPQRLPVVAQPTLPLWAERRCRIAHTPHECERADDRVRENVPRRLPSTPLQSILERRHPRRDGAVKIALPEIFACAPSIFGKCDGRGTPDNKCSRIAVPTHPSPPPTPPLQVHGHLEAEKVIHNRPYPTSFRQLIPAR